MEEADPHFLRSAISRRELMHTSARVRNASGWIAGLAVLFIVAGSLSMAGRPPATHFTAHLQGDNEVPPRGTRATGQIIFSLNEDETELEYKLITSNIFNVVAAHIH